MTDIGEIRFDANGLVPAVVTDAASGKVLMLAYMNEESLKKTIQTGLATFWSRSRQELWTKGETSGNYMHVVSITADCDRDSLVIKARPDGPACHLGTESCFEYPLFEGEAPDEDFSLESLYKLLQGRKAELPEGSYTTYLFQKGTDKILKKVGEEATEIVIAAKNPNANEIKYEISDFLYHIMVLMVEKGVTWEEIMRELANR